MNSSLINPLINPLITPSITPPNHPAHGVCVLADSPRTPGADGNLLKPLGFKEFGCKKTNQVGVKKKIKRLLMKHRLNLVRAGTGGAPGSCSTAPAPGMALIRAEVQTIQDYSG